MGNFISKINSSILNVSNAYHGLTPDVSTFNVSISHSDSTYFTTSVIKLPTDVMLKSVDGSNYSEKGHTHKISITGATSQGGSVVPSGTINKPGITAGNTVGTFSYISDCAGSVTSTATTSGNVLSTWSYDSANEALSFTKSNLSFSASPTSTSKNVLTNTSPSFSSGFTFTGNALTGHNHTYNVAGFTDIDQTTGRVTLVDLGLPSGKLWADRNVGATCEDTAESWYGNYYAWAETAPKTNYAWYTYQYYDATTDKLTKYNMQSQYGTIDNKTALDAIDDPATVNQNLRLPTLAECTELVNNTTTTYQTNYNGITGLNGVLITGTNGNTIFLPANGYKEATSTEYAGTFGILLMNCILSTDSTFAYIIGFAGSASLLMDVTYRYNGIPARGVQ